MTRGSGIWGGLSWSVHTWDFSRGCSQMSAHSLPWQLRLAVVRELSCAVCRSAYTGPCQHSLRTAGFLTGGWLPPEPESLREPARSHLIFFSVLALEVIQHHLGKAVTSLTRFKGKELRPQLFLCKCQRIWGRISKPYCFRQKSIMLNIGSKPFDLNFNLFLKNISWLINHLSTFFQLISLYWLIYFTVVFLHALSFNNLIIKLT